ncbi:MAG: Lon-insertion domain-containing protein, partial [Spirochaetota bacterium]
PRNEDTIREYVAFVRKITTEEGLLEPCLDGIAAIVEYGVRLSEKRSRLSTRFSRIADLIREADYRAELSGKDVIDADAVDAAQQTRARLANLPEEKLADMIVSGEILLQVDGEAVGRVNGLAVHDRGYYAFGLPAVISAQVSPGESGVINIEGESGLSGEIYDKAVLIVEGFLRSRYARDFPLAVSASICFEQSYTAIEGDSASSTAVYALLSAIARVPLRQNIAVTGSVNQMGQIQPVGGVSEKVEGFYHICKKAGFTGTQGVMIPKQNIGNLTLCREVLEAIKAGKFSIYAVSTIDEGIQVLTSLAPGVMGKDGSFPAGSFNAGVASELRRMAETVKEYLN